MALQDPHGDDLNPGQTSSNDLMEQAIGLNNTEKSAGNSSEPGSSRSDIENAEETPNKNWVNNVTGNSNRSKVGGKVSFLKKKGPITGIILTLVGGGMGIGGLLSGGLLPLHLAEVLTNKFNNQLTSMDIRSTKLLATKMNTVKGLCTTKITVMCKYSTMSDKQIKNFEKAGIKVEFDPDTPKSLIGRQKPKGFTFGNETVLAQGLNSKIKTDPAFRSALKTAYNPKFAGFTDKVWKKVASKFKLPKSAANLGGDTDADNLKKIQETTKGDVDTTKKPEVSTDDHNPETLRNYTSDEVKQYNAATSAANELGEEAEKISKSGVKSAASSLSTATKSIGNTLKITGYMDDACTAFGTIQAVGYAAKGVRAMQLAKYAMIFLNVASQIKAGDAKPDDVSYIGKVLTSEYAATKLTATDSFGYKYAAYGDKGNMSETASMFLTGGGLTGRMIGVTSMITSTIPGNPKKVCRTLNNPFVGGASAIVGIGTLLIPGAQAISITKMAYGAAKSVAFSIAISFLPTLLKDILAGVLIDKDTVGEASGDAITSGASVIMGSTANKGGNAPMTPEQAVAYSKLTDDVLAQYAEEDRIALSPFDISSSNTMMGMFAYKLIPYIAKLSSVSGAINSITSLSLSSLSSIVTPAKAVSVDDYTMCQDFDYREMGLATDPYCNVMYGLPAEALEADPIEVSETLLSDNQIDEETGDAIEGSDYAKFITECIDRDKPIGDTDSNASGDGAANCFYSKKNKNYYIHHIDQRVQDGMDQDIDDILSGDDNPEISSPTSGSIDPGDASRPANTIAKNKGWTFKDNTDYSNIPCAPGSTDKSTYTHPGGKFKIRRCSTPLGVVASAISQRVLNMVAAAKKDGVTLSGSGFRLYEEQATLYRRNCTNGVCSPPTAKPGNSQHERGLAVDFNSAGKDGAVFKWLKANGADYGFINLPSESWHWSMSGY